MRLVDFNFLDQHDYKGILEVILTVEGTSEEIWDIAQVFAGLEKYLNDKGFSYKNCISRGQCTFVPKDGVARRVLMYRKIFPPKYDPLRPSFFDSGYTSSVKNTISAIRKKCRKGQKMPVIL